MVEIKKQKEGIFLTQTEGLKLNIWSADDPVNVGQINQNFQKIDAASKYVKLMDIHDTVGGANQINLNLTGISLRDYAYLELVGCLSGAYTTAAQPQNIYLRLNGVNASCYVYGNTNTSNSGIMSGASHMGFVHSENGYGSSAAASSFRMRIYSSKNRVLFETQLIEFCGEFKTSNFHASSYCFFSSAFSPLITPDNFNQINFCYLNSEIFVPGSKITVYGVMK